MKKLLFFVAIATIGLTTSCKKSCESCALVVTQNGREVSNTPIEGSKECTEALKLDGTSNTVTLNGTTSTSQNKVTCK
jgi:hypothetical protein